ncbi:uncharacterized protein WCC33_006342 [Rhinophrynus dorsalis]
MAKSAFITQFGLYQFTVMPFRMKNAPATFQRLVDHLLTGAQEFACSYLDDIAVFSESWDKYLLHVEAILGRIFNTGLTIRPYKCQLGMGKHGNTPLHYAAHANNQSIVKELLQDGCNVLKNNGSGLTPLHFAAFGGNVEILQELLSRAPHAINIQSIKGSSLLHEAVRGCSIEAVKFLIENGADPNLQDQEGNTPLHLAASLKSANVSVPISQILLEEPRLDPGIQNRAKENFFFSIVRGAAMATQSSDLLISLAMKCRLDLLSRNLEGLTVLDVARMSGSPYSVIRHIQECTQEQQKVLLDQTSIQLKQTILSEQSPKPTLEVHQQRLRRKMKLFVCGHSGVGKTTFTNTLRETGLLPAIQYLFIDSKSPDSSKGVSLSHFEMKDSSLVIWDFAGQMEYYFTYSQLLATSNANTIFCLIFSLEGVESDHRGAQSQALEQIRFWLRFLSIACKDKSKPHLILIGSHLDKLPEENKSEIVNCFFLGVKEMELFRYFQYHIFSINCKSPSDVQPVREALDKIVTESLQDSIDDTVPYICQFVMEQVRHLSTRKVRFLRWKDFADNLTQGLSEPICTFKLLTAVEYLHNISELLYLPWHSASNTSIHNDHTSSLGNQPDFVQNSALQSHSISSPQLSLKYSAGMFPCSGFGLGCSHPDVHCPSGLVIFDLHWLLQDIFGRFGNFSLGPASGRERECWSPCEIKAALELEDGEDDPETALELLEELELLFRTTEGKYVVPAWLKRGGPVEQGGWEKVRGVGYRWEETSRGLFSHFLVGQLQIRLLRMFGFERCQLWKEGAKCIERALLRVNVSEDKRSLYLIGGWSVHCYEGDCYKLLEKVGREVEKLLREGHDQGWKRLHLSPRELNVMRDTSVLHAFVDKTKRISPKSLFRAGDVEISGFSWEQILQAEQKGTTLCGRSGEVQTWELLFPQHDTRMLNFLKDKCSTRWLEATALEKLCSLLDTTHPIACDWKQLAELLGGATHSVVTELKVEAKCRELSPTCLVLDRYPVSVEQLLKVLKKMEREDCTEVINNMMKCL